MSLISGIERLRRLTTLPPIDSNIPRGPRGKLITAIRTAMAHNGAIFRSRNPINSRSADIWYEQVSDQVATAALDQIIHFIENDCQGQLSLNI